MTLKLVDHHLLLLPGMDGTGWLFRPLLSALPRELSASVVSYPQDTPLSYDQLLPCLREKITWDRPMTIVAESYAGPLALEFAVRESSHVHALVLVNAFVTNPFSKTLEWAASLWSAKWFRRSPTESFLRKYLLGDDCPPILVDALLQALRAIRPEVLAHRLQQVLTLDARQLLAKCQKPILCLRSEHDRILTRRAWDDFLTLKPNITTLTFAGPHLLLQRKPRETVAAIEQFLSQLATESTLERAA